MSVGKGSGASLPLVLAGAAVLLAAVVVIVVSGVPGGSGAGGGGATPPPGGSSYPAPMPLALSTLSSKNVRTAELFRATVHTRPYVGACILVSSRNGPSTIGGLNVELSPDWFFLAPWTWTGGGQMLELTFPIPDDPSAVGLQCTLQGIVIDPMTSEVAVTNAIGHEVSLGSVWSRRVLVLRQTISNAEAPFSAAAADALAAILLVSGHTVDVVDDALPAWLAPYDCIFDCRFTLPPSQAEKGQMLGFLRSYGGIFLISGPAFGSSFGQMRFAWIQDFMATKLGIAVTLGTGGNLSGATAEQVAILGDPELVTQPSVITGVPWPVEQEGGSFGPAGAQPAGTPFIVTTSGPWPIVYGMSYRPNEMTTVPVTGSLVVLFDGAAGVFATSPQNPYPDAVVNNIVCFLDS